MPTNFQDIKSYYDDHVGGKIKGYVYSNERVEAAWKLLKKNITKEPTRILEVGCGIGDFSHRMSKRWPKASIDGLDISAKSVELATMLFGSSRLRFQELVLSPGTFDYKFDLIVLIDVYEHISVVERNQLHASFKALLSEGGNILMTCPTPEYLGYLRNNVPDGIQPVDEDITTRAIQQLEDETGTKLRLFKKVKVWHPDDYVHIILSAPPIPWTKETYNSRRKRHFLSKLRYYIRQTLALNPLFSEKTVRQRYISRKLKTSPIRHLLKDI